MYRCEFCKKIVPANTPCKKVTVSKMFQHPFRPKVHKRWGFDKMGKIKLEWIDDVGGRGPQIEREHLVCYSCKDKETETLKV